MRDVLAACAAFLLLGMFAPQLPAQSLSDAYLAALQADPDHAAAEAARDAADENQALARSLLRPRVQVQANGAYSRLDWDIAMAGTPGTALPGSASGHGGTVFLGMEQPLVDGSARAQARQLRAGALAGDAEYEAGRQALALRVARSYFDVLRTDHALATLLAEEASARREQQAAQARFDAGRARITDVREAQAMADVAAARIVAARAQQHLAATHFRELTGLSAATLHVPGADITPQAPAQSVAELQEEAYARSPLIEAQRQLLAASRADADQYHWANQVRLSARAGTGRFWPGGSGTALADIAVVPERIGGYFVGLQLQVPLYTGGGLDARRRQSLARARESRSRVDAAHRDIRLQVEQAWSGQQSGAGLVVALRTALASARLQEQAALTGRDVGTRTQSDVLAAQAQVLEISRQLNEAACEYEFSRIALRAAVGDLTLAHLLEVDRDLVGRHAGTATRNPSTR